MFAPWAGWAKNKATQKEHPLTPNKQETASSLAVGVMTNFSASLTLALQKLKLSPFTLHRLHNYMFTYIYSNFHQTQTTQLHTLHTYFETFSSYFA